MSWIKKAALYRLLGGVALLWLLVFFLFDPVLKFGLVKAGEAAAGAKVEIASLKTKWLAGTLELRGIQVADKNQPMKNLVEFSRAAFALDVGQALRGKGVVREAALEGLRVGTPRRTSGALRNQAPSKLEAAVEKSVAPVEHAAVGEAARVKSNAVGAVDASKLQGLKKLDEAKAKSAEVQKKWKDKAAETQDIAKRAQEIENDLKSLRGGNPVAQIQKAAADQKKIKDLIARVDAQRDQAKKDLAEVQDAMKQADELRHKDVDGLLSAAGMPTLDSQDLARRLLGAQTASRLATALHWMRWARERAAARKAAAKASASASAAPPAPARRAGVDVEFPRPHAFPQYLLEDAKLAGTLEDLFMGQAMALSGDLQGVTSNPDLYGKPATLTLSGKAAGGAAMKLYGELDQQNDPVGVVLKLDGSGFSLAGATLGDAQLGAGVSAGTAKVSGELRSAGDEWKGEVLVAASGVRLDPRVSLSGPAGGLVSNALKSLSAFNVRIGVSGKESDLKLAFSSNIGDVVAGAMKKAVTGEYEAQRKALQAKVDALYNDKLKGVKAQTDGTAQSVLGPLDAQRAALDRQLQDAVKKAVGGGRLPDFKKLFK